MVSLERIEHAVKSHPDPVVTVGDVVEHVDADVSDTHARQQMRVLEASGALGSKDVGARAVAWWHSGRVMGPATDPADHPDQAGLDDLEADSDPHSGERDDGTDDEQLGPDWLPETPPSTVHRSLFVDAAEAIVKHVRETGGTSKSEAEEALHDEFHAGYGANARTWWRRVARPVMSEHPDVESPPQGASRWTWSGQTDESDD